MRKNVASQVIGVQMVSATDGSAFTGSVTVYVTGDAGTQSVGSVGSGACTHEGNGYHTYAPSQAETNYDLIAFTFIGTGAIPQTIQVETRVDANVTHYGATAGTFSGGRPEVNTTLIEGTDATNQIRDAVVDDSTRIDASALNTLSSHDPGETIMGATDLGTGSGLTSLATAASIAALNDISAADVHSEVHTVLQDAGLNLHLSTISSLTSQTSFALTTGSPSNDSYNDCIAVIRDADNSSNLCVARISDYAASGRVMTLGADPGVFTIAVGDSVAILPKDAPILASIAALNNLSQADVRTAVGLAAANLDTQLGDLPTNSELSAALASADDATLAAIAALNNLSAATVRTQCDDALVAIHLDHLLAADYDPASKPGTSTALLNELIGSDAGVSQFTANALELAPTGGSAPTAAQIRAEIDANSTQLAAIVADTNELQTDWVNGGRLDLILDARASQTSVDDLPTNAELAAALGTADDATLSAIAAEAVKTAAIKAKTDNLPAAPAATGDIPSAATVASAVRAELTTELGRVDVAVSTRLASASYTAPLTSEQTTDAVEAATITADADEAAIASAVVSQLAGSSVTVTSPVLSATEVEIVQGDDYYDADGRAITFTITGAGALASFAGGSCSLNLEDRAGEVAEVSGTIVTGTGSTRVVRFDVPSTTTADLREGRGEFEAEVTLSGGHVLTLVKGTLVVRKQLDGGV